MFQVPRQVFLLASYLIGDATSPYKWRTGDIFWVPEYWRTANASLGRKKGQKWKIQSRITEVCKRAATYDPNEQQGPGQHPLSKNDVVDEIEEIHPHTKTQYTDIANPVPTLFAQLKVTKSPNLIRSMSQLIQSSLPDAKHSPQSSNVGMSAFMDFQQLITEDDDIELRGELQISVLQ